MIKIDDIKEIFYSLNKSSFIISEQEKVEFKSFIESSDQLKESLDSRKIMVENILKSLDSKRNYSKTKHNLILSFSMFKINEMFENKDKTFIIEPEY